MQSLRTSFSPISAILFLFIVSSSEIGAHPTEPGATNETVPLNATSANETACPGVPKSFYEELDCKPVFENPGDSCPVRYTCESFEQEDLEMCYFRGEAVSPNTMLNDTGNPCDIGCSCQLDEPSPDYNITKMAVFECAAVDCPFETELAPDEEKDLTARNCVLKKSHDECCATGTICPDDNVGDGKSTESKTPSEQKPVELAKCVTSDNKTYIEGQEFYPVESPCKSCICEPGYRAGENVEPWCREIRCGALLSSTRKIREGCAPIYYSTSRCCPIDFLCPNSNDTVISDILVKIALNPEKTCKFGELFLRVGDRLAQRDSEKCVECKCEVPPFVTCSLNADCYNQK